MFENQFQNFIVQYKQRRENKDSNGSGWHSIPLNHTIVTME